MTNISIYDVEADMLNRVAETNDATVAEVVEALCDYLDEVKADNGWD